MGKRREKFRFWRAHTYFSFVPILGASSGGDILQVGPLAGISRLMNRNPESGALMDLGQQSEKTHQERQELNPDNEMYLYQSEDVELVVRNYAGKVEDLIPEEALDMMSEVFCGIMEDPYGEVDHKWVYLPG